tara:strand:- start:295 stop:576 length:282 start_codon:yes stop_codon:yes gene_type:complete
MLEFESELNNLMNILKEDHKEYLEVGDEVIHRHAFNTEEPKLNKVLKIIRYEDQGTSKYINKISWSEFKSNHKEYVVDLPNSYWAYNYQIDPA